ncbi:hypothetical protein D3C72_2455940 [compost metagenome]
MADQAAAGEALIEGARKKATGKLVQRCGCERRPGADIGGLFAQVLIESVTAGLFQQPWQLWCAQQQCAVEQVIGVRAGMG